MILSSTATALDGKHKQHTGIRQNSNQREVSGGPREFYFFKLLTRFHTAVIVCRVEA
jgi:hypothetical protein